MLVLTRKQNEKILIGEDITITITKVEGGKVRVGIEAPSDVPVRREELLTQWEGDGSVKTRAARRPALRSSF